MGGVGDLSERSRGSHGDPGSPHSSQPRGRGRRTQLSRAPAPPGDPSKRQGADPAAARSVTVARGLDVLFTEQELLCCLPPAGDYLARIAQVHAIPCTSYPQEVEIRFQVIEPESRPFTFWDRIRIRGNGAHPVHGLRRLLFLLHLAEVAVSPMRPVDLHRLIGTVLSVRIAPALGPAGFPYPLVVECGEPWVGYAPSRQSNSIGSAQQSANSSPLSGGKSPAMERGSLMPPSERPPSTPVVHKAATKSAKQP